MRLIMLVLAAGALAPAMNAQAQDQAAHEKAVTAIRKLGGEVRVDSQKAGSPVVVVLAGSRSPSQCLPQLKDVSNLHTCDL